MSAAAPAPLLSAEQVAQRLGMSRTAVYSLCESGELRHYRLGAGKKKRYRVSEEQLSEYLAAAEGKPSPQISMPPKLRSPSRAGGYSRLRAAGYKG